MDERTSERRNGAGPLGIENNGARELVCSREREPESESEAGVDGRQGETERASVHLSTIFRHSETRPLLCSHFITCSLRRMTTAGPDAARSLYRSLLRTARRMPDDHRTAFVVHRVRSVSGHSSRLFKSTLYRAERTETRLRSAGYPAVKRTRPCL